MALTALNATLSTQSSALSAEQEAGGNSMAFLPAVLAVVFGLAFYALVMFLILRWCRRGGGGSTLRRPKSPLAASPSASPKGHTTTLHEIQITVNRNAVPNDPRPPMVTSGLRIGTPALATRGFGDAEFAEVADIIALALLPNPDIDALRARVATLTEAFPLYPGLSQ